MKTTNKILFTVTALAFQSLSYAAPPVERPEGDGPPKGERPPRGERGERGNRPSREEVLAKFDKDSDGKLSPQERVPMIKERMKLQPRFAAMLMEKFDADKSGELSDPELLEAAKKMSKRGKNREGKKGKEGKKPAHRSEGRE